MIRTLCVALLLYSTYVSAQPRQTLTYKVLYHAGINPAGELYVLSEKGIQRFDKDGELLNTLVVSQPETVTQFDAWHLTQLILYYRGQQRVDVYNPEPTLKTSFVIDSVFAIEPQWIAASFDQQHFWIFDQSDVSVKKVNYKTGEVVVDESAASYIKEPVLSSREYQRFLFLQTASTLFVLNSLGKKVHTFTDFQSFGFFGEELMLINNRVATLVSLFSTEKRSVTLPGHFQSVFITDETLFGIKENRVEIFPFDPR